MIAIIFFEYFFQFYVMLTSIFGLFLTASFIFRCVVQNFEGKDSSYLAEQFCNESLFHILNVWDRVEGDYPVLLLLLLFDDFSFSQASQVLLLNNYDCINTNNY